MAKLKNIIRQLSEKDYITIHDQLMESNAEKSAYLFKSMRERSLSDTKIMEELDVNTNAYYTLRSRLNQKIEEYLLQQMENPRTDILKKVANINEIVFTKKKTIAIATLKKLEKELLDYDLSNELTIIYKTLKKLHINSPDHFTYSQLYNKHVAYMLAVDKAEDILSEYFKKFGIYSLTGDETERLGLDLLNEEMYNICALYDSHRLYVYKSCLNIFHRLHVKGDDTINPQEEPIEDILDNVNKIINEYHLDSIYYHLQLVFEFLKLEYYNYYKVYRKAEEFFEGVNESAGALLSSYNLFTHPAQFLVTKIERHLRTNTEMDMYEENDALFADLEIDKNNIPQYVTYVLYRALSCYYADRFDEAARWINNLLNDVSLKKYPVAQLEIKLVLALQYCLMNDFDLFNQLINSIQRQIRLLGKESYPHIQYITKILKISISESKRNKGEKIRELAQKISMIENNSFSPTRLIKMDDKLIGKLSY